MTIEMYFKIISLSGIFIMIGCMNSCMFMGGKPYAKAYKKKPYDAVIVTGIPYDSANGKWDYLMKIRVYWSWLLYKNGIAKNIIYSGSAVYTPYMESRIM